MKGMRPSTIDQDQKIFRLESKGIRTKKIVERLNLLSNSVVYEAHRRKKQLIAQNCPKGKEPHST